MILELFYTMRKLKLLEEFSKIIKKIEKVKKYEIISLDIVITRKIIQSLDSLEMHDKIIVATASILNIPLVTKDEQMRKLHKNTIW